MILNSIPLRACTCTYSTYCTVGILRREFVYQGHYGVPSRSSNSLGSSRLASLHAQETPRAHTAAHAIFPGQIASADAVRWSGAPRLRWGRQSHGSPMRPPVLRARTRNPLTHRPRARHILPLPTVTTLEVSSPSSIAWRGFQN